jgi:hypothetical protein
MNCFTIRKWRKNRKNTGALLELSFYDEEREEWRNALANVPFAANYAGTEADEKPATMCKVKDGILTLQCTVYDDYFDEQAERVAKKTAKKAAKKTAKKPQAETEEDDEDEDEPF